MFVVKACEIKKSGVPICRDEYFFDKRNADNGHYGQTLTKKEGHHPATQDQPVAQLA